MYFADPKGDKGSLSYIKSVPYWHRPAGAFLEVIQKTKKEGLSNPTKLAGKYMELYTASLFGMGFEVAMNTRCWLTKPSNDPPDCVFMSLSGEDTKKIYFNSREAEVTRYLGNKELLETITNKDKDKAYPPDYVLTCFFEPTGSINLKALSESLQGKLHHIGHVFLIGHGIVSDVQPIASEIGTRVSIIQLVPQYNVTTFAISQYFEDIKGDNRKLVYVEGRSVCYGLRDGDTEYPKLITE